MIEVHNFAAARARAAKTWPEENVNHTHGDQTLSIIQTNCIIKAEKMLK
jgi:hypothetical protein